MVLNHSNYYCNNRDSDPSFFFPRAGMLHVKPLKANTFLFAFKQHLRSVLSHICCMHIWDSNCSNTKGIMVSSGQEAGNLLWCPAFPQRKHIGAQGKITFAVLLSHFKALCTAEYLQWLCLIGAILAEGLLDLGSTELMWYPLSLSASCISVEINDMLSFEGCLWRSIESRIPGWLSFGRSRLWRRGFPCQHRLLPVCLL